MSIACGTARQAVAEEDEIGGVASRRPRPRPAPSRRAPQPGPGHRSVRRQPSGPCARLGDRADAGDLVRRRHFSDMRNTECLRQPADRTHRRSPDRISTGTLRDCQLRDGFPGAGAQLILEMEAGQEPTVFGQHDARRIAIRAPRRRTRPIRPCPADRAGRRCGPRALTRDARCRSASATGAALSMPARQPPGPRNRDGGNEPPSRRRWQALGRSIPSPSTRRGKPRVSVPVLSKTT